MQATIRWSLKVSRDTDIALRTHLAQAGMRKGDLSKFVEAAVQKEVFARTVAQIKQRNTGESVETIQGAINDALSIVRLHTLKKPAPRRRARRN